MPRSSPPRTDPSWSDFLDSQADAHYCHLEQWGQAFEKAYRRPFFRLASETGGRLDGVLSLVAVRTLRGNRRLVGLPYLDRGGPAASSLSAERDLLEQARSLAHRQGIDRIELRDWTVEPAACQPETARHRYVLELPPTSAQLWTALKGKVRNQIRKAQREELTTVRVPPSELADFYRIFALNMRDLGSPTHSLGFFRRVLDLVPGTALYLTRNADGEAAAAAIAVSFRDQVCVPWASSLRSARASCPNHSLYWQILADAIGSGARSFDFGRSWEDSGPARFKQQWGTEQVPLYWTELRADGTSSLVGTEPPAAKDRAATLWRKLPLPVATFLGTKIRPHLAS